MIHGGVQSSRTGHRLSDFRVTRIDRATAVNYGSIDVLELGGSENCQVSLQRRREEGAAPKCVVLCCFPEAFASAIRREAERIECSVRHAVTLDRVSAALAAPNPHLALVNLDTEMGIDLVGYCRSLFEPPLGFAAITKAPCLHRAGEAIRKGASVVLAQPTSLGQVIVALGGKCRPDPTPMSLDRAVWEYLNQALAEAGSISAAARRLRVDRTSLKRMLRKAPPRS
jgi:ActR/RegA family two-component response regulator